MGDLIRAAMVLMLGTEKYHPEHSVPMAMAQSNTTTISPKKRTRPTYEAQSALRADDSNHGSTSHSRKHDRTDCYEQPCDTGEYQMRRRQLLQSSIKSRAPLLVAQRRLAQELLSLSSPGSEWRGSHPGIQLQIAGKFDDAFSAYVGIEMVNWCSILVLLTVPKDYPFSAPKLRRAHQTVANQPTVGEEVILTVQQTWTCTHGIEHVVNELVERLCGAGPECVGSNAQSGWR